MEHIEFEYRPPQSREALAELQDRSSRVMDVRRLPGADWLYHQTDAHSGVRLDRDTGARQDADVWLAEVAAFVEGEEDAPIG